MLTLNVSVRARLGAEQMDVLLVIMNRRHLAFLQTRHELARARQAADLVCPDT